MNNKICLNATALVLSLFFIVFVRSQVIELSYQVLEKRSLSIEMSQEQERLSVKFNEKIGAEKLVLQAENMKSLETPRLSQWIHINKSGSAVSR